MIVGIKSEDFHITCQCQAQTFYHETGNKQVDKETQSINISQPLSLANRVLA